MHTHTHTRTHAHTHTNTHACTCTHTHTHTNTKALFNALVANQMFCLREHTIFIVVSSVWRPFTCLIIKYVLTERNDLLRTRIEQCLVIPDKHQPCNDTCSPYGRCMSVPFLSFPPHRYFLLKDLMTRCNFPDCALGQSGGACLPVIY